MAETQVLEPEILTAVTKAMTRASERAEPTDIDPTARLCLTCNRPALPSNRRCARCAEAEQETKDILAAAAERIQRRAVEYADIHLTAAQAAASKGNAEPSQWALLHTRSVQPVETKSAGGPAVTVQIGMILPGLPGATASQS
jgi:hypothetical protein